MKGDMEIAWSAGFIDGEGCFGIHKQRDDRKGPPYANLRASLQVSNTQPEALLRLRRIFGVGEVLLAVEKTPRHKAISRWQVRKQKDIIGVCMKLLPHLVIKRPAMEQVLAFCISRQWRAKNEGLGRRCPYNRNEQKMVNRVAEINKRVYARHYPGTREVNYV